MATESVKIIVFGSVLGQYARFVDRLRTLHEKNGPFDAAFCVGSFFPDGDSDSFTTFVNDTASPKVPVPTYIVGGGNKLLDTMPEGGKLCYNVYYLGKQGIKDIQSLRIAFLSGVQMPILPSMALTDEMVESVIRMADGSSGVDVLLTNQWPEGILNHIQVRPQGTLSPGSDKVARAVQFLRPRYHFASGESIFYLRPPYQNTYTPSGSSKFFTTRFIGLANSFNEDTQKYVYAVNLVPIHKMPSEATQSGITPCPWFVQEDQGTGNTTFGGFVPGKTQPFQPYAPSEVPPNQRAHLLPTPPPTQNQHQAHSCPPTVEGYPQKRPRNEAQDFHHPPRAPRVSGNRPTGCWFCLSTPQVETHLIVSVGTQTYLTLAKGGVVPDHTLIIPIAHISNFASAPPAVVAEMNQYVQALRVLFSKQNKLVVFVERYMSTQSPATLHAHVQAIPFPIPQRHSATEFTDTLRHKFLEMSRNRGVTVTPLENEHDQNPSQSYLTVNLPSTTPAGQLFYGEITGDFPLQWAREVAVDILRTPERYDWKACVVGLEEERFLADSFKNTFATVDFSVQQPAPAPAPPPPTTKAATAKAPPPTTTQPATSTTNTTTTTTTPSKPTAPITKSPAINPTSTPKSTPPVTSINTPKSSPVHTPVCTPPASPPKNVPVDDPDSFF
ncbi:nuclear protein [Pelomyxa schiedti]|nr:nuclear protein [Pelomyxa schiedti]